MNVTGERNFSLDELRVHCTELWEKYLETLKMLSIGAGAQALQSTGPILNELNHCIVGINILGERCGESDEAHKREHEDTTQSVGFALLNLAFLLGFEAGRQGGGS